jgi:hypothetical protein
MAGKGIMSGESSVILGNWFKLKISLTFDTAATFDGANPRSSGHIAFPREDPRLIVPPSCVRLLYHRRCQRVQVHLPSVFAGHCKLVRVSQHLVREA